MSNQLRNKSIVTTLYEECLNAHNPGRLKDLISPHFKDDNGQRGPAAFENLIKPLLLAFPDIHWKLEQVLAEEKWVSVRWVWTGTQRAPFRNLPATGKRISNSGMAIFELEGGCITGARIETDRMGFLQNLGYLPADFSGLDNTDPSGENVYFIDKFRVPAGSIGEFLERTSINRRFIRGLPGFLGDRAFSYEDNEGFLCCITVARWASRKAVEMARKAVGAEYARTGFDPVSFLRESDIRLDRGIYSEMCNA